MCSAPSASLSWQLIADASCSFSLSPPSSAPQGHRKWITGLAWEPAHVRLPSRRVASGSRDGDLRVWDVARRATQFVLSGHTLAVTCVKWGGDGVIYSG